MKNWRHYKEKLLANWGLKLASFFIAFALWFVVIIIDDPVDAKTFTNIQVKLVNTELITDNNMVYEILEDSAIVKKVTFDAPKSVRDVIEAADIIAEADFENLTATDTVAITYSCPKYASVSNISGNVSSVKLNIEDKATKWVNIEYNVVGDVEEGFLIGDIELDQNRLEIVGPASKVSEINKAVIDVDVAGISADISTRADIHYQNLSGEKLAYDSVASNVESVRVTVDVDATKAVPVKVTTMGVPAEGYMATGEITMNPQTVLIAGDESLLKGISAITVAEEEVNVTGAIGNFEQIVDITKYLPQGTYLADDSFNGLVDVVVSIEQITSKEFSLTAEDIAVEGVADGMVVEITQEDEIILTLLGLSADLQPIEKNNLHARLDVAKYMAEQNLETLPKGTYPMTLLIDVPEGVAQLEAVNVIVTVSPTAEGQ